MLNILLKLHQTTTKAPEQAYIQLIETNISRINSIGYNQRSSFNVKIHSKINTLCQRTTIKSKQFQLFWTFGKGIAFFTPKIHDVTILLISNLQYTYLPPFRY